MRPNWMTICRSFIVSVLPFSVFALCDAAAGQLNIWRVDDDAPPGGDGLDWPTAFNNLQDALDTAEGTPQQPDLIRVAQGMYSPETGDPDPREATFLLDFVDVTIEGGYAGITEPDPNLRDVELYVTVLDGSFPPVNPPGTCGGGTSDCFEPNDGVPGCADPACCELVCSAIPFCCNPPLGWTDDCATAAFDLCPAGVYHVVTIQNVDTRVRLDGVTITGGSARGLFSPLFMIFDDRGGGMLILDASPVIVQCTFTGNGASSGGALAVRSSTSVSEPLLVNCSFLRNRIGGDGGAVRVDSGAPFFANCVFSGNVSNGGDGGAFFIDAVSSAGTPIPAEARLVNCTVNDNEARTGTGGAFFVNGGVPEQIGGSLCVNNSIIWGNAPNQILGSALISFSDVQGVMPVKATSRPIRCSRMSWGTTGCPARATRT